MATQDKLVKVSIDGLFFDCYLQIAHDFKMTTADHPIAEGATVTDHSYLEPQEIYLEILMSDVGDSFSSGQFADSSSRSVSAAEELKRIWEEQLPIPISTKFWEYENMMMSSLNIQEDSQTVYNLHANVQFKEKFFATINEARVPVTRTGNSAPVAQAVNQGNVQPQPVPRVSVLREGATLLGF